MEAEEEILYLGFDLKAYQKENAYEVPGDRTSFTFLGEEYNSGLILCVYSSMIMYNLGGNFSSISGIFGRIDGVGLNSGHVKFYVDSAMVKEIDMKPDQVPVPFVIDVMDSMILRIEFTTDYSGSLADSGSILYALADVELR